MRGLFLVAVALSFIAIGESRAQVKPQIAGWGVNAGYATSPTAKGSIFEAYYDIPMGYVYFSPGMKVMFSDNDMFSVETRVRFELFSLLHLGLGGSVMVWQDRVSIGVPVELTRPIDLMPRLQLNLGASVTPLFFIGKEKDGVMLSLFVGLRSPVL